MKGNVAHLLQAKKNRLGQGIDASGAMKKPGLTSGKLAAVERGSGQNNTSRLGVDELVIVFKYLS